MFATSSDVEASMLRPLTQVEKTHVETLLGRVELMISTRLNLDEVDPGSRLGQLVAYVEAEAVARVLRNPAGLTQEADGQYSYQVSTLVASGLLGVLPREWELLGVSDGVWGSARPIVDEYARTRYRGYSRADEFGWNIRPDRVAGDSISPSFEVGP